MRHIKAHMVGGKRGGRVFTLLWPVDHVLTPVEGPYHEYRLVRNPPNLPDAWPERHHIYVDVSLSGLEADVAVASYLLDWQTAHSG